MKANGVELKGYKGGAGVVGMNYLEAALDSSDFYNLSKVGKEYGLGGEWVSHENIDRVAFWYDEEKNGRSDLLEWFMEE